MEGSTAAKLKTKQVVVIIYHTFIIVVISLEQLCGDVVLDILNMESMNEDSNLNQNTQIHIYKFVWNSYVMMLS